MFALAIWAALSWCVLANTGALVSTPLEFRQALVNAGVQHIVITNHLDLTSLAAANGTLAMPFAAKVSTAMIRGRCTGAVSTTVARKAQQCVITTPRGFVDKSTAGTLWLHNLYLRNTRGASAGQWADSIMVGVKEADMYLTDVTFEGASLPSAAGPQTEMGLVATASHVFASGCIFRGFQSPEGMAVMPSLRTTLSLHSSTFTDCRAAVYMGGDVRTLDLPDVEVSAFQRLLYLDIGSTATSAVRLEDVAFSGSGEWDFQERFFGGGDVSVYDLARVYSDVEREVPHECGNRICDETFVSKPLGCAMPTLFLSQSDEWLELALAAEAQQLPGQTTVSIAPSSVEPLVNDPACADDDGRRRASDTLIETTDRAIAVRLVLLVIVTICAFLAVLPVARACVICWRGKYERWRSGEVDPHAGPASSEPSSPEKEAKSGKAKKLKGGTLVLPRKEKPASAKMSRAAAQGHAAPSSPGIHAVPPPGQAYHAAYPMHNMYMVPRPLAPAPQFAMPAAPAQVPPPVPAAENASEITAALAEASPGASSQLAGGPADNPEDSGTLELNVPVVVSDGLGGGQGLNGESK